MKVPARRNDEEGGDPACWVQFICGECGGLGDEHLAECSNYRLEKERSEN